MSPRTGDVGSIVSSPRAPRRPASAGSRRWPAMPPAIISPAKAASSPVVGAAQGARHRRSPSGSSRSLEERRKLERDLTEAKKRLAMGGGGARAADAASRSRGMRSGRRRCLASSRKISRPWRMKAKGRSARAWSPSLPRSEDGKCAVVVGVTDDLTGRLQCGRSRARGLRGAGRQGRRRPARHGAGRRTGRLARRGGDRGGALGAGVSALSRAQLVSMVMGASNCVGEEAGGDRPDASPPARCTSNSSRTSPSSLIQSTMSPVARSTICTPHQGSVSRLFSSSSSASPQNAPSRGSDSADDRMATVEGEPAQEARAEGASGAKRRSENRRCRGGRCRSSAPTGGRRASAGCAASTASR